MDPLRRFLAFVRRHRWTIGAVLVVLILVHQTYRIREAQVDSCQRGNVLRGEIVASNTVLDGLVGAVTPDPLPEGEALRALPPRVQFQIAQVVLAHERLELANQRLGPTPCGSVWGLP